MPTKTFVRHLCTVYRMYLDDDAKLRALARVPVGSDIVLEAVGKLAWCVVSRVYIRYTRPGRETGTLGHVWSTAVVMYASCARRHEHLHVHRCRLIYVPTVRVRSTASHNVCSAQAEVKAKEGAGYLSGNTTVRSCRYRPRARRRTLRHSSPVQGAAVPENDPARCSAHGVGAHKECRSHTSGTISRKGTYIVATSVRGCV